MTGEHPNRIEPSSRTTREPDEQLSVETRGLGPHGDLHHTDGNRATITENVRSESISLRRNLWEVFLLFLLFFVHAGGPPPAINEAHYLCKAKNYWDPGWCANDMFVTSGKAHVVFYSTIGWLTKHFTLDTTAWIGRVIGWLFIAWGLQKLSWHVAPLPYASLLVGLIWIVGVEKADLAGEWIIGGIEAKVLAYGFVLLGLHQLARCRWHWVWPLLGAASAFHVLVGGWSVLAAVFAFLTSKPTWGDCRNQIVPLVIGGTISLGGIVPGLSTMRVEPSTAVAAANIYTYERIAHHLYPAAFSLKNYLQHGLLIAMTIAFASPLRNSTLRPLLLFGLGSVLIGVIGLLIGTLPAVAPDLAARLLRFYWFRSTDAFVPLVLALSTACWLQGQVRWKPSRIAASSIALVTIITFVFMFANRIRVAIPEATRQSLISFDSTKEAEYQRNVYRDWRKVCDWVSRNSSSSDVFLTSRHQQSFKWFAGRAEVVNWKDVPQDAESLLEWRRRMEEIFPRSLGSCRVTFSYRKLRQYRKKYNAQYIIIDKRLTTGNVPLVQVYPHSALSNTTFSIYSLP